MHFYSGPPLHLLSGVDTAPATTHHGFLKLIPMGVSPLFCRLS
jgi:hypothetical protein